VPDDDVSVIPSRPVGQILDLAHWFSEEEKEEAQRELGRLFAENQIDVYLVTRKKIPPQGVQTYARKLGETWSRAPVWCVVFHVPGDPAGFHVEAGGVEIKRKQIEQAVQEACRRARKENTEKDRVMAAWQECSQGLRFIYAQGQRRNEQLVEKKKEWREETRFKMTYKKVLLISGGIVLLALASAFWIIWKYLKRKNFSYTFPETVWRTRYLGPHSGGGGVVVNFKRKRLKR